MRVRDVTSRTGFSNPHQHVGIEIEIENCYTASYPERWRAECDGSLRGNGYEFISEPLPMPKVREEVEYIYQYIKLWKGKSSIRTGIHVHFDMLKRTFEEVAAVGTIYALVEPSLYRYVSPERDMGSYCVPWYRAPDEAVALRALLGETSAHMLHMRLTASCCKYSGLNLLTLLEHGTIEFRMAQTFLEPEQLIEWVELLNRVVQCGIGYGTPAKVVEAATQFGIGTLIDLPDVDIHAAKMDAWYCAEILAGTPTRTWEGVPMDFSDGAPNRQNRGVFDYDAAMKDDVVRGTQYSTFLDRMLAQPTPPTDWDVLVHDGIYAEPIEENI